MEKKRKKIKKKKLQVFSVQKTLHACQQSQSYWSRHCGKSM